jgi:trigger factor
MNLILKGKNMRKNKIFSLLIATTMISTLLLGCKETTNTTNEISNVETSTSETLYTPSLGDVKVTLNDYTNIDISGMQKYEITKDDIQMQIDDLLNYFAEATYLEEGIVEDGSTVYISFNGYLNDVLDENTCSTGYELTIGSNQMIPGFESGLIGASVGDTVELNLTFPKDYGHEDYNGKDVRFEVEIINLVTYEKAEWNDEFANKNLEYATAKEYEDFLWEDMQAYYNDMYSQEVSSFIIENLLSNSSVENISEEELSAYTQEGVDYYKSIAESYEMDFQTFITSQMGVESEEEFMTQLDEQAKNDLNYKYIMLAIGEKENIVLTQADYDSYLEDMATYYGVTKEEIVADLESGTNKEDIYMAALCDKVVRTLIDINTK